MLRPYSDEQAAGLYPEIKPFLFCKTACQYSTVAGNDPKFLTLEDYLYCLGIWHCWNQITEAYCA